MTVSQAFARFEVDKLHTGAEKTRKNYRSALKSFVRCNGDIELSYLFYEHILRWKQYMSSRGNAPSTVAHDLGRLRKVLKYLKKHGYKVLDPEVIEVPRVKSSKITFLDYSEIQSILDAAERPRDKAIIACLFSTGCRISELLGLNRNDLRDGEAIVHGKNGEDRPVYFDFTALKYLHDYLDTRTDKLKPLFISGQRRRITVSRIEQILHEIVDSTNIEKNVTPHVLRHSFATDLLVNGADIRTTQELLGHNSITSTMVYTHVTDARKRESFRRYHSSPS